jgi:hypothetical protein
MNSDSDSVGTRSSGNYESSTEDVSSTGSHRSSKEGKMHLGENETRAVRQSRAIVMTVLFISATVTGAVTYMMTKRGERRDFEAVVRTQ